MSDQKSNSEAPQAAVVPESPGEGPQVLSLRRGDSKSRKMVLRGAIRNQSPTEDGGQPRAPKEQAPKIGAIFGAALSETRSIQEEVVIQRTPMKPAWSTRTKDVLATKRVADPEEEMSLRLKLQSLLDPTLPAPNRAFSIASTAISLTVFVLIILSVTVMMIDSLPQYYKSENSVLFALETLCIVVFTVEVFARFSLSDNRWEFLCTFLNIVDIISIAPYYLEFFLGLGGHSANLSALAILRVVRLARIFRVLKLGSYSTGMFMVIESLSRSSEAIILLSFLLGIAVVVLSAFMFLAEKQEGAYFDDTKRRWYRADNSLSPFQSILHTFWWAMVTLTTVGYGDAVPETMYGKMVACVTIVSGVLVLGFPVILITSTFTEVVEEVEAQRELDEANERQSKEEKQQKQPKNPTETVEIKPTEAIEMVVIPPVPEEIPIPTLLDNTVVANMKIYDKIKSIWYVSTLCSTEGIQLRYEPLFRLQRGTNHVAEVGEIIDETHGLFIMMLTVHLDDEAVQIHAYDSVMECGTFDTTHIARNNVHAKQIDMMTVRVAGLPPECTVITDKIASPGYSAVIYIKAPDHKSLQKLIQRLEELTLHLKGEFDLEGGGDFEVTIPLYSMKE